MTLQVADLSVNIRIVCSWGLPAQEKVIWFRQWIRPSRAIILFDIARSSIQYDFLNDEAFAGQENMIARYLKPDLLIIDDMGIKQLPKRSGEYLFEIVMRRYETKSTIMTSNRPLEDWGKLLGDVPSATAILDRFLHHAEIITITGRSYRLKDKAGGSDINNDKSKKEKDNDDNVQKKTKSD